MTNEEYKKIKEYIIGSHEHHRDFGDKYEQDYLGIKITGNYKDSDLVCDKYPYVNSIELEKFIDDLYNNKSINNKIKDFPTKKDKLIKYKTRLAKEAGYDFDDYKVSNCVRNSTLENIKLAIDNKLDLDSYIENISSINFRYAIENNFDLKDRDIIYMISNLSLERLKFIVEYKLNFSNANTKECINTIPLENLKLAIENNVELCDDNIRCCFRHSFFNNLKLAIENGLRLDIGNVCSSIIFASIDNLKFAIENKIDLRNDDNSYCIINGDIEFIKDNLI